LKDVENADREGRYRADWESLKNYEAPEWYKLRIRFLLSAANGIRE
jgi:hypothetical protein